MRKEMTDDNISSVPAGMPALGRCGGLEKLGDHRGAGSRVEVKRPRRCDGRAALPDARVRASATERKSESDLVVEAPRLQNRPQTWRTWVGHSDDAALIYGGSRRARRAYLGVVTGGRLRVPVGEAVGVEPASDPVKRIMVNVGDASRAPGRWWRSGKARCRLMGAGRVGVRVVVRGRGAVHMAKADSRTVA
jgi:hypothetical protein